MRLLIAEDDADIRAFLEVALMEHTLVTAEDGAVALQLLESHVVDAAVLDVMMPKTDGLTVCRAIRADARLRDIPIVMLTAKVSEDDHIKGYEAGADRYVTKPFDPEVLLDTLSELAGMHAQRRLEVREEELRQARFLRRLENRF